MDQIQQAISKKNVSPYVIQRAYLESEALVLWMAKERGESWVPNVVRYLQKHGGSFDEAFEAVLNVTPASAMENLHHAWD